MNSSGDGSSKLRAAPTTFPDSGSRTFHSPSASTTMLAARVEVHDGIESRVGAFMLFRVAVLGCFGLLAALANYLPSTDGQGDFTHSTWTIFGIGYGLSVLGAWLPYRLTRKVALLQLQTVVDTLLAAIIVQVTGGADSGFSFLYLIAILGAAATGELRHCWASAGACALIYSTMTGLQALGTVLPMVPSGHFVQLSHPQLGLAAARTLASIGAVGYLASHLNGQWRSSQYAAGSLRALNENIVHSMASGLLTIDNDGRMQFANPMALEILDLEAKWRGRMVDDILPGIAANISRALDPGLHQTRFELRVPAHEEGANDVHLGLSCCPLRDQRGRVLGHLINFQDVSELRRLEARVRRTERLVAVGELAATVAHEVRNPLAAMAGCAQLLESSELDAEDSRLIAVIIREAKRLEKTVDELLQFTRPKPLERAWADLRGLCEEVVEGFMTDPGNATTQIQLHFDEQTSPESFHAMVDASQLTQVLWNLLRNAREAQVEQPVIEIEARRHSDEIELEVRDHGPGMTETQLERAFEPNYTTKSGGNGFGLALALRVVEGHGGTIEARSAEGSGAVLALRLPIGDPPQQLAQQLGAAS